MADSPNDALQTYKVSGRKSPMGRVGEQKEKKSQKIAKKSVGIWLELGWNLVGIRLEFGWNSVGSPHQGAGSVGKKDLKIPKLPYMANTLYGKCLTWQVPYMAIALYGNCLVWQAP